MATITWHESIPLSATHRFNPLVNDYVARAAHLREWVSDFPSPEAMEEAIKRKQGQAVPRTVLVNVLRNQYADLPIQQAVHTNIDALLYENTFSVCTAHQPLLFTGPLYFVYKTAHAIALASSLSKQFPDKHFVPVFYLGSEDHDLDEIGHCFVEDENLVWFTEQQGACGRMTTMGMQEVVQEYSKYWNEQVPCEKAWVAILREAYNGKHTLAEATRILLHHLFGAKGLVVLDADNATLKQCFIPVMAEELFGTPSELRLKASMAALESKYTLQAKPRSINLFYLCNEGRFRIEKNETAWVAVGSDFTWNEADLRNELHHHPERFSPNVILRPLYQETILPNVAFIGGGGELAYWLPLKANFDFFNVAFPILFLRNSLLYISASQKKSLNKKKISNIDLFLTPDAWFQQQTADSPWLQQWQQTERHIQNALINYHKESNALSADYQETITAHQAKINRILERITQKTKAHIKRHNNEVWDGFVSMQNKLFPKGNLQERYEHGVLLMKYLGEDWLDVLLTVKDPYSGAFTVFGETV